MLFVQGAATATIKMAHVHVWIATKARHVRGRYVLHMPAMAMADAYGRTAVALPLVASAKHHSMVGLFSAACPRGDNPKTYIMDKNGPKEMV